MPWKKGQSGNPQGRRLDMARRLLEQGMSPSENVYIPILDKRDPAKELIKLADKTTDKEFKKAIWTFLFEQKYKAVKIVSKPAPAQTLEVMSDEDMLRALESKPEIKPLESNPSALQAVQEVK